MFKNFLNIIKKIIISFLFVYGFNIIMFPISFTIPINVFVIGIVTIFGLPGLLLFCIFSLLF